jgi:hypothetical protein
MLNGQYVAFKWLQHNTKTNIHELNKTFLG